MIDPHSIFLLSAAFIAVVCLIVCGLTLFFATDGIVAATTRAWRSTRV